MDDRLSGVVLRDEVRQKVLADAPPKRAPRRARRAVLTAVAACLVLVFGVGVAAAAFPQFEHFLARMGEDLRSLVHPVEAVDVQEGIRMEVLAAVNDGEAAIIYLSLQDLQGSRIDEYTEIYHVKTEEDPFLFAPLVDYDAESGTAIFRLEMQAFAPVNNQNVSLTLGSILTGVQWHEPADTGLSLADVLAANALPRLEASASPETALAGGTAQNTPPPHYSGSFLLGHGENPAVAEKLEAQYDAGQLPLLARNSAPMPTSSPAWAKVTAAGMVDGMLHVQYQPVNEAALYAQTTFFLTWPGASRNPYESPLTYAELALGEITEEGARTVYEYYEAILEVPEGVAPEEVTLMAAGMSCEEHIAGGWNVHFALEDCPPALVAEVEMDMNGWVLHSFAVSSIGIEARGVGNQTADSTQLWMEVYLKDGTLVRSDSTSVRGDAEDNLILRNNFTRPIDIAEVDRLVVNGQEVPLQLEG